MTGIEDAFQPSSEATDPNRFSGRASEIAQLSDKLRSDNSALIIIGRRGLGKSSIAAQIRHIATGRNLLLQRLGREDLAVPEDRQFLVATLRGTKHTRSFSELLPRMTNLLREVEWERPPAESGLRPYSVTGRTILSPRGFAESQSNACSSRIGRIWQDTAMGDEEKFIAIADSYSRTLGLKVLIVIDELDVVADTTGLASFIRMASSTNLKFMLVGIADTTRSLLADHKSIERLAFPVEISQMNSDEMREIIDRALTSISAEGLHFYFQDDATDFVIEKAEGYPWLVHLVGRYALRRANRAGRTDVEVGDVADALVEAVVRDLRPLYQRAVDDAVQQSPDIMHILSALAESTDELMPESTLLGAVASAHQGETRDFLAQLYRAGPESLLRSETIGGQVFTGLRDQMLKTYIRLLPSQG